MQLIWWSETTLKQQIIQFNPIHWSFNGENGTLGLGKLNESDSNRSYTPKKNGFDTTMDNGRFHNVSHKTAESPIKMWIE